MREGRIKQWAVVFAALLTITATGSIPDRVNVSKFKEIHTKKRQLSIRARRQATEKRSTFHTRKREREVLQAERDNKANQVQLNRQLISGLTTANQSVTTEINETKATIAANQNKVDDLLAQKNGLDESIQLAQSRVSSQTQAVSRQQTTVNGDQADVNEAKQDLAKLNQTISGLQTQLSEAQNRLQAATDELGRHESSLRQQNTAKDGYQAERRQLQARAQRLAGEVQAANSACETIQTRLAEARQKKVTAEQALAQSSTEISGLDQRLVQINQTISGLESQVTAKTAKLNQLGTQLRLEQNKLAELDDKKTEIEELNPILQTELQTLFQERLAVDRRIDRLTAQIEEATGEEKTRLRNQLRASRTRHQNLTKSLQEKRALHKQNRDLLLAIPGQKTGIRRQIRSIETEITGEQGALTGINTQLTQAKQNKAQVEQNRSTALATKATREQALTTANGEVSRLTAQDTQAQGRLNQLKAQQGQTIRRQIYLRDIMQSLLSTVRILEQEAIPGSQQRINLGQTALGSLRDDRAEAINRKRQAERNVNQAESILTASTRSLNQAQSQLSTLRTEARNLESQRRTIVNERVLLIRANQTLATKVVRLEQSVVDQTRRITDLTQSTADLQRQVDALEVRIASATEVETIARGAYQLADASATQLEEDTSQALVAFRQTKARYESEKADAIALATAEATAHGGREGAERGSALGNTSGVTAGTTAGNNEGTREGGERDYNAALAAAHGQSLNTTVNAKTLPSAAELAQKDGNARLSQYFDKGDQRGFTTGRPKGVRVGDNATKEGEGFTSGLAQGKRRAEDEAERTHKPLGRQQAEAAILQTQPKQKESRDASQDVTAWIRHQTESWFAGLGAQLWAWILPEVVADSSLGEIADKEVPAADFTYRVHKTDYDHPDFNASYATAYDSQYETAFKNTFKASHKSAFVAEYNKAFASAKQAALAKVYEEKKQKGTQDGTLYGRFEGLGYNGGHKRGFAEGKQAGEKTAYERGEARGKTKGYEDNLASAQQAALRAGKAELEAEYRNNVRLKLVANSQKLEESTKDNKYNIGEQVSVSLSLRNFGGLATRGGEVVVEVDPASLKGIRLDANSKKLAAIESNWQLDFSNVLTGKILGAERVTLKANVKHKGTQVGQIELSQAIYAPYYVVFSEFTDPNKSMRVGGVGNNTGYHNAVWVQRLGSDPNLMKDVWIRMRPVDSNIATFSWQGGSENGWKHLGNPTGEWKKLGIFVYAHRSQGLQQNKMEVELQNRAGRTLYKKVVDAPVRRF